MVGHLAVQACSSSSSCAVPLPLQVAPVPNILHPCCTWRPRHSRAAHLFLHARCQETVETPEQRAKDLEEVAKESALFT